ncbi:T9SS type A sorting domain-containing protein [uncultured Nonlabens sp.]|uniref:type IX secretion system anionic LPS delivery protein PorZ n=1 Tax=uncultured Nonlabens sp. TaxID=859306 RepID=UPI002610AA47|nr:T9SS type A sorting domain-containing protein [uncultured Nonlabens sp.]
MKKLILLLILVSNYCAAQDFSDSWEGLFSFTNIIDIVDSDDAVYAASENAVFIYDLSSGTFTTLTTVNGLSGDNISQIHYSESQSTLVIGYENGLLQVVDARGNVTSVVAIQDKQVIAPDNKRINEFKESGDLIYMATDFGIAIYNLERLEFDDTYFIGDNGEQLEVKTIELFDNFLYAGTANGGIRRASIIDPFLIDFANWTQINGNSWDEVENFNNRLFATAVNRFLYEEGPVDFLITPLQFPGRALDFHSSGQYFTVATRGAVLVYDLSFTEILRITTVEGISYNYTQAITVDNDLFIGTEDAGMIRVDILNQNDFEFVVADGPARNAAFTVATSPDELWVGYGDYDVFYNPFPLERFGISHLTIDAPWENLSFDDILNVRSLGSITINPTNSSEIFLNSMNDGLVQLVDGAAATLFDNSNSSLILSEVPTNNGPFNFQRLPDSEFDNQGNLWVSQSLEDNSLHRRSPSGQWRAFDLSDQIPEIAQSTTKMVITDDGKIIYGTIDIGLVGFDPETSVAVNIDEDNNLVNNYIASLRLDLNGQLWIGSNLGLRILFNPNSMFTDTPRDARSVIIEDTNGIARELLQDEAVLDIEIDGNNNKWVATASSGAFLFSPSGRETLFQFTTDNSPLPTNSINDIAIDEATGKVYFATNNGIVAFQGQRSSKPQDDLENVRAFPNPVRPGFDGNVTIDGLTDRARVKITDIEGNLVYEAVSQGGSIPWDTRSFSGDKVASGVYLLFISTSDNIETAVSKIMIVR